MAEVVETGDAAPMVDESVVDPNDPLREALEAADEVSSVNPAAAEEAYVRLLSSSERVDEVALKVKEEALYRLAKLYVINRQFDKVLALLQSANALFSAIPKVLFASETDLERLIITEHITTRPRRQR